MCGEKNPTTLVLSAAYHRWLLTSNSMYLANVLLSSAEASLELHTCYRVTPPKAEMPASESGQLYQLHEQ